MKLVGIIICFLILISSLNASEKFQHNFIDFKKEYRSNIDTGFDQYATKSLFKKRQIVLTFDDGPKLATTTPRILDLLGHYQVKATFFLQTYKLNNTTIPLVIRMFREGHTVATHNFDHNNPNTEERETFKNKLKNSIISIKDIAKLAGVERQGIYFRFPYGAYGANNSYHHFDVIKEISEEVFGDNCIVPAFWDINSVDWHQKMTPDKVANTIVAHIDGGWAYTHKDKWFFTFIGGKQKIIKELINHPMGGGVVLMHDTYERSVEALALFLQYAKEKGIKIVPINEVEEFSFGNSNNNNCRYGG